MKIKKFNSKLNINKLDNKYPFKCKFKNRIPDPGICHIIILDFENEKVECSNGKYRYHPNFDEIEIIPDIFIFNKYDL